MSNRKDFLLSTLIVAVASLLSRVLGLLRSTLLASYYGATESAGLADCYQASFTLPDILYNLIVLGAVSIVLVPYFSASLTRESEEVLNRKASGILNFFFLLIALFALAAWITAPYFVRHLLVRGFTDESNIALTVKLTRIMLLQPVFMTLSGILGSYINAREKYTSYSLAMLSYNVGIISGIVFLSGPFGIEGVAWGTVLGGFLQFSIQLFGVIRSGFRYSPVFPRLNREFAGLFTIAIPRIIALGSEQFVKFFFTYLGSFIATGSIIIFSYAENFAMVPFGMIAVSLSTTAFPVFAKLYASERHDEMIQSLFDKIRIVLYFMLPVTILMAFMRYEIIDILLGYRNFTKQDTVITARALVTYLFGIPFYSLTILFAKYFYARLRTFSPMIVSLAASGATVALSFSLVTLFSGTDAVQGLTIARSAGYGIQMLLLLLVLFIDGRKYYTILPVTEFYAISRVLLANFGLALISWLLVTFIPDFFSGKLHSLFRLSVAGIGGMSYYICVTYLLKLPEFEVFKHLFRKVFRA